MAAGFDPRGLDALSAVVGGYGNNVFMVNIAKQNLGLGKFLPWSIDEVYQSLVERGIPKEDAKVLHRQDVDGESLPSLNDDNLTKMGIPTFGRRNKILRVVNELIMDAMGEQLENHSSSSSRSRRQLSSSSSHRASHRSSSTARYESNEVSDRDHHHHRGRGGSGAGGERDYDLDRVPQKSSSNNSLVSPSRRSFEKDDEYDRPRSQSRPRRDEYDDEYEKGGGGGASTTDYESGDDSDVERRYEHPRELKYAQQQKQASSRSTGLRSSGAPDDDDLFATGEATQAAEFMAVKPWLGAIVAPTHAPKNNSNEPDRKLRLDWVHGYRAFDSRSNLVYNAIGDVVYPVAGVCVVFKSRSRLQKHFMGHDDDIRCLSQHPVNQNIIATGQNATIIGGKGTPPHICVWDSTDFSKVWRLNLTQADRAVRSVAFSSDGKYLVSVSDDDNHSIKVWDWEKRTPVASAKGDRSPIYQVRWNHKDASEFVTVGKKHAMFWSWDGKKIAARRAQLGKDASKGGATPTFYSVAFSEKGYACLGSDEGSIYIFDHGNLARVFKGIHQGKVFSIDWYPGGLVSGGSDKSVCILDRKMEIARSFSFTHKVSSVYIRGSNLLIGTQGSEVFEIINFPETDVEDDSKLEPITTGHFDGELWAMAPAPDGKHFVTVGEDNTVCIWDIPNHRLVKRGIINEKAGKMPKIRQASTMSSHPPNQCSRSIAVSPNGKHILIGCNDGWVHVLNSANLAKIVSIDLNKHGKRQVTNQQQNWIQCVQYSPSGHSCAVGTHGFVICLLDVMDGYKVKGVLKSHNSYLTHLDWSEDGNLLQSNCGAYELLFHNVDESDLKHSSQATSASALRDTKWSTQTCTFGWPVQGIFDGGQDGSDVNCVDVNASHTLVATGDDNGDVNLYRYPALKGNKKTSYGGHSSHVPTVRFTPDEKWLISTGGHDLAVMQWAIA